MRLVCGMLFQFIVLIELEQQGKNSCTDNSNMAQNYANVTRMYDIKTQKQ